MSSVGARIDPIAVRRVFFPAIRPSGFSIAGFVLAVITAVSSIGGTLIAFAVPIACALVFSGIGFVRSRDRRGVSDGFARWGLAFALGTLLILGVLDGVPV